MKRERRSLKISLLLTFICLAVLYSVQAQDETEYSPGRLDFVSSVSRESLDSVTSVEISDDGKFLYASAWAAASINVYARNLDSGELSHVQELTDPDDMNGSVAIRLSPDGRYAVVTAFRSQTVSLFQRDPDNGKLTLLDTARNEFEGVKGLKWPVDAAFSPDSNFVFVIDARGMLSLVGGTTGGVASFQITDEGNLNFIEFNTGENGCLKNSRGIVISPDGKAIVVAASTAGTLVVLDCNPDTGKTTVRQIIKDNENGVVGLQGAMGLALSRDGRFLYVSSGRFSGDDAVGAYEFDDDGRLISIQELINNESDLVEFSGGNEIVISGDGRNVYAAGTSSGTVACLERDTTSGELSVLGTLALDEQRLAGVAGICISPDDRFVYFAVEKNQSIAVFRRCMHPEGNQERPYKQNIRRPFLRRFSRLR